MSISGWSQGQKPPKRIRIDDARQPVVIRVPTRSAGYYVSTVGVRSRINLGPPILLPKDFGRRKPFFTNYTSKQGLPISDLTCGYKDHSGNLWFGSYNRGVLRYDGNRFMELNATTDVSDIVEDNSGTCWFGNENGLTRYDGRGVYKYVLGDPQNRMYVLDLMKDRTGRIWIGTLYNGVYSFDPKKSKDLHFTHYAPPAKRLRYNALLETSDGIIFTGTSKGLFIVDRQGVILSKVSGLTIDSTDHIKSLIQTKDKAIWIGTKNGLIRWHNNEYTRYTVANGLPSNEVTRVYEASNGTIWIATSGGIAALEQNALRNVRAGFASYTEREGLMYNQVRDFVEDEDHSLWIVTNIGLSRLEGAAFSTYEAAYEGKNYLYNSNTKDLAGNEWFGVSGGGLIKFDRKRYWLYNTSQGLASNQVTAIATDKLGHIWAATLDGGASMFDGQQFTNYTTRQGLFSNIITSIVADNKGRIWFVGDGGVSCLEGSYITTYTKAQGFPAEVVFYAFQARDGKIWFGSNLGDICYFDEQNAATGRNYFVTIKTPGRAYENSLMAMAEDQAGNIWFSSKGLFRYDGKTVIGFSSEKSLPKEEIVGLAVDKYGDLWLGTFKGIIRLRFRKEGDKDGLVHPGLLHLPNNEFKRLKPVSEFWGESIGYPVKSLGSLINNGGLSIDEQGIISARTTSEYGVVRFAPSALHKNNNPPKVLIHAVAINGNAVSWYTIAKQNPDGSINTPEELATQEVSVYGDELSVMLRDSVRTKYAGIKFDSIARYYPIPGDLALPFRLNGVSITFGVVAPAHPNLVRYQYMLVGYSDDWSPWSNETLASFGNISEGQYTFKVRAISPDGVPGSTTSYSFRVLPPWYRHLMAYLSYVLLGLLIIVSVFRWRVRKLKSEQRNLEAKIKERTLLLKEERDKSEALLLNILPAEIAEELKLNGVCEARQFQNVTVMLTDFVDFTIAAERMGAKKTVAELHACFTAFDEIMVRHDIEKIKTVGDAYLAVCGLPQPIEKHAQSAVLAAIDILDFMNKRKQQLGSQTFEIRIGIHSGPVVAGIVGVKKYAYDIWGDTVNTAARLEQNSEKGKINISRSTYELVKERFSCTYRGELPAKNKGNVAMYFVDMPIQ